jgi:hypothetical protein
MTAIKQISVTTAAHASNLGRYLNDERALSCSSQNLVDEKNWESEMAKTRASYGHDSPSRAGAANTVMYHQVLGFNPDECSMNGGPMTEAKCMEYARQYIEARYPNQEAIWVLHKEYCKADKTSRYAVHIGINRTDLETGRRLAEGRGHQAKIARANAVRDMDAKWGLRQLEANKRNSRVHARQPTRAEKEIARRGLRSDKQYVREAVEASVHELRAQPQGNNVRALGESLDAKGVKMKVAKSGCDFTFERKKTGLKVNGNKLGRDFGQGRLVKALGMDGARLMIRTMDEDMER